MNLAQNWIQFNLEDDLEPVYFDWMNQEFSLTPVVDAKTFLTIMKTEKRVCFDEINKKLQEVQLLVDQENTPSENCLETEETLILKEPKYKTLKDLYEIKALHDELDQLNILIQVCEREFQTHPNWRYGETINRFGGVSEYIAILDFNQDFICSMKGKNKKEAKFACARMALSLVAPNVFRQRYPKENYTRQLIFEATNPENVKEFVEEIPREN